MPVNASRNSRPSRGEPSPTPLQPHPKQVLPDTQVGGGAFIRQDAGQDTGDSMESARGQSEGWKTSDGQTTGDK